MNKRPMIIAASAAALLAGGIGWATVSAAEKSEQSVAVKDLPKNIASAISDSLKDATIVKAETETKHGNTVYELDLTLSAGKYEAKVSSAGKLLSLHVDDEKDLAVKDLPQPVVAAVKSAYQDGTITDAEQHGQDSDSVYELDVTSGGKNYEMKIAPDGKVLKQKEEEKDED